MKRDKLPRLSPVAAGSPKQYTWSREVVAPHTKSPRPATVPKGGSPSASPRGADARNRLDVASQLKRVNDVAGNLLANHDLEEDEAYGYGKTLNILERGALLFKTDPAKTLPLFEGSKQVQELKTMLNIFMTDMEQKDKEIDSFHSNIAQMRDEHKQMEEQLEELKITQKENDALHKYIKDLKSRVRHLEEEKAEAEEKHKQALREERENGSNMRGAGRMRQLSKKISLATLTRRPSRFISGPATNLTARGTTQSVVSGLSQDIGDLRDVLTGNTAVIPPEGKVTLVFTDIQGSTQLWETHPEVMQTALTQHNTIVRESLAIYEGYEVKTQGDSFMCTFKEPVDALLFCVAVQVELMKVQWPKELENLEYSQPETVLFDGEDADAFRGIRVRMGMHSGYPICEADPVTGRMDYFGPVVNKAARVESYAYGGEIVATAETIDSIDRDNVSIKNACTLDFLNSVQLKGIEGEIDVYEVLPYEYRCRSKYFKKKRTQGIIAAPQETDWEEKIKSVPKGMVCVAFVEAYGFNELCDFDTSMGQQALVQFTKMVTASVEAFSGYISQVEDDRMMITFTETQRAVLWALRLQEDIIGEPWSDNLLTTEWASTITFRGATLFQGLRPKIGLHRTIVSAYVEPLSKNARYHGDQLIVGPYMAHLARPGEILMTEPTWQHLQENIDYLPNPTHRPLGTVRVMLADDAPPLCCRIHQMFPDSVSNRVQYYAQREDDEPWKLGEGIDPLSESEKHAQIEMDDEERTRDITNHLVTKIHQLMSKNSPDNLIELCKLLYVERPRRNRAGPMFSDDQLEAVGKLQGLWANANFTPSKAQANQLVNKDNKDDGPAAEDVMVAARGRRKSVGFSLGAPSESKTTMSSRTSSAASLRTATSRSPSIRVQIQERPTSGLSSGSRGSLKSAVTLAIPQSTSAAIDSISHSTSSLDNFSFGGTTYSALSGSVAGSTVELDILFSEITELETNVLLLGDRTCDFGTVGEIPGLADSLLFMYMKSTVFSINKAKSVQLTKFHLGQLAQVEQWRMSQEDPQAKLPHKTLPPLPTSQHALTIIKALYQTGKTHEKKIKAKEKILDKQKLVIQALQQRCAELDTTAQSEKADINQYMTKVHHNLRMTFTLMRQYFEAMLDDNKLPMHDEEIITKMIKVERSLLERNRSQNFVGKQAEFQFWVTHALPSENDDFNNEPLAPSKLARSTMGWMNRHFIVVRSFLKQAFGRVRQGNAAQLLQKEQATSKKSKKRASVKPGMTPKNAKSALVGLMGQSSPEDLIED